MRCWCPVLDLTEDTKAATATVHVLDDKHTRRILSVSADNLPHRI